MKKRYALTLIEVMVVILIIGLIGGALAFNMRGSLDEGKAFKTEQRIARGRDILMMEYARGEYSPKEFEKLAPGLLVASPLALKDPLKGGWNEPLTIEVNKEGEVDLISKKLKAYREKHAPAQPNHS